MQVYGNTSLASDAGDDVPVDDVDETASLVEMLKDTRDIAKCSLYETTVQKVL